MFIHGQLTVSDIFLYIIGIISSAVMGYLTIKFFIKYISRHSLWPFIIYRLVLGAVVIASFLFFK
jgi:undecaprenyl-diphosphatase